MFEEDKQKNKNLLNLSIAGGFRNRVLGLFKFGDTCDCLLISPCRSVHTFGLDSYTDLAFFDERGVVVKVERLSPWRMCSCRGAEGVLERPCRGVGLESDWFQVGERLSVSASPN